MTTQEIDARKIQSIKLPTALKKGRVFVIKSKDTIIFKKIQPSSLSQIRQELKKAGSEISQKDIDSAIKDVREK